MVIWSEMIDMGLRERGNEGKRERVKG